MENSGTREFLYPNQTLQFLLLSLNTADSGSRLPGSYASLQRNFALETSMNVFTNEGAKEPHLRKPCEKNTGLNP